MFLIFFTILFITRLIQCQNQTVIVPPGSPPGAYNSLVVGSMISWQKCPGNNSTSVSCYFPSTPLSGQVQWTCPAGNYCLGPGSISPCTRGFYCPPNAAQPIWCPKSFYCSNDTTTLKICPANFYCPQGTITPLKCGTILAYCPEGTSEVTKYGIILFFLLFLIIPIVLFKWKESSDRIRFLKHKFQIEHLNRQSSVDVSCADPVLKKLDHTFDIYFENLSLTLPSGVTIMKGVTGHLKSGRTTAIMGPSGAGKTTFVTLLTGKVPRTTGKVVINGQPDELSKYKKLIGYVPQEDIMLRELTVREILMHSARMRLPKAWDYPTIKNKVLEIISFLGMGHVMDSIVGNEEERGISGGQRKRVNIGMELVAEPSVLFLDEPTSGLDSSTAFEVCSKLKSIAQQQGLTVAAVIHSPSPATFKQFDDFLLLGKGGQVVYMGPRDQAVDYFRSIGFPCPSDESPSDFFMDIVSGKVSCLYDPHFQPTSLFMYWEKVQRGEPVFDLSGPVSVYSKDKSADVHILLQKDGQSHKHGKAHKSKKYNVVTSHLKSFYLSTQSLVIDCWDFINDVGVEYGEFLTRLFRGLFCIPNPIRNTCSLYLQLWLLMKRAFRQVFRDAKTFIFDILLHFGCGTFISIATQNDTYLGSHPEDVCVTGVRDLSWSCSNAMDTMQQAGMFVSLGVLFAGIASSLNTFGREKVVFWRDTSSGMSAIPYYLAKFFIDIPRTVLAGCFYSFALTLFFPIRGPFTQILGIVIVLYFAAYSMGYFLSIFFSPAQTPLIGTGFALLWGLVLSGVQPSLPSVDSNMGFLGFLWKLSPSRYSTEAFWISEVGSTPFAQKNILPSNGYIWTNTSVDYTNMILITLGWHLMAFFSLKMLNRTKQK